MRDNYGFFVADCPNPVSSSGPLLMNFIGLKRIGHEDSEVFGEYVGEKHVDPRADYVPYLHNGESSQRAGDPIPGHKIAHSLSKFVGKVGSDLKALVFVNKATAGAGA